MACAHLKSLLEKQNEKERRLDRNWKAYATSTSSLAPFFRSFDHSSLSLFSYPYEFDGI